MNIYLDYAATTPVDPRVSKAMFYWQENHFGNPSSLHRAGQRSKIKLEESRDLIAMELGCLSKEIVFTSGGTESNNLAIIGACLGNRNKGNHIITTSVEHPSVLKAFEYLEQLGFEKTIIKCDQNGSPDLQALQEAISDSTVLVSMMYVNNETGIILPIQKVSEICRNKNIIFHCDAVQAFGKIEIKTNNLFDLLSFSGHKIYGPKGIGGLFVRDGIALETRSYGGGQEANKRPGTENLIGIVGLAKALELMSTRQNEFDTVNRLKKLFEETLLSRIENCFITGSESDRSPYISGISFTGTDNQSLLLNLDMQGIGASVGSACSSGSIKQSHVLQGMQLAENLVNSAIRFSFGRFTTEEEIKRSVEIIEKVVKKLRS
ncbi:MAG: cysteine desulfurase [Calditrichaeota bacterium]|nr:cysteine desulfurase [Calditrichota bacterium]